MGSYSLLKNQPLVVELQDDFAVQGWSVSNGIAYHSGCNPGKIKRNIDLSSSTEWTFRFRMGEVTSGTINIVVDGVAGPVHSTPGIKEDVFTVSDPSAEVYFFSTGINSVEFLEVFPADSNVAARTIVFNEDENGWGGDHSYTMEYMHKFMDDFFVLKDGQLWMQDVNPVHNNFFGEQFTSKIRFVANDRPQFNKMWLGIKINGNGKWSAPKILTQPNETYPNGMQSRLGATNFTLERGEYWADLLRDELDPQWSSQLEALFNGRTMEGNMLIVELETKATTDIKLNNVYIYSADQKRNF